MGFWGDAGRVGLATYTFGSSELAKKGWDKMTNNNGSDGSSRSSPDEQGGGLVTDFTNWTGLTGPSTTNQFKAQTYDPNAAAYQIQNQYGGALGQALAGAQGRSTPNAATAQINTAQSNQGRGMQMGLAEQLQQRANGQAPSVAELQMGRGLQQAIASQRAQAASARGVSPGMAQRLAAQGISQAQGQANSDAAVLRAGEQQQAESALGQQLMGMRGQDIGLAAQQAGFQQQTGLANQQAELANRAQMDSATQAYMSMGMSREEAQQRALADMEALKAGQQTSVNQSNAAVSEGNAQRQQQQSAGLIGGIAAGIGAVAS